MIRALFQGVVVVEHLCVAKNACDGGYSCPARRNYIRPWLHIVRMSRAYICR